jgi:hypothetical protein
MSSGLVSRYQFRIFLSMSFNAENLRIGGLNAKFGIWDFQDAKQEL